MLKTILTWPQRATLEWIRFTVRTAGAVFGIPAALLPPLSAFAPAPDPDEGPHAFLSSEWVDAARRVRESYRGRETVKPPAIRVNQIVTGVPFGDATVKAYVDTTSGELEMELGHLDGADLTVTLPYDIAKSLVVDADVQGALQAFMSGRISVDGDVMKLIALQTVPIDPIAIEAAARIRAITR